MNIKLILRNNIFLFTQIFINILVTIFSLKLIINSVGLEDYGIYTLVFGFVIMFSFLTSAMSFSCVRFFSYYSKNKLQHIFHSAVIINLFIAIIVTLVIELIGYVYFENFINIELDKILDAKIIFHIVVFIVFFKIIRTPFEASIQSRQDFHTLSIIETFDLIFRFLFVLYLPFILNNKIIYLAFSVAIVTLLSTIFIIIFSFLKYDEITFKNFEFNKTDLNKFLFFFSWNTFGAAAGLVRNQGINIVLNSFFGPVMNAYYGISQQINSTLKKFTESFLKTFKPIAYKYEGDGKRLLMFDTINIMSKYGFFIALFIGIPIITQVKLILKIWIDSNNVETIVLSKLFIVLILVNIISSGAQTGLQAIGKIKYYQATVGSLIIIIPLFSFILLKLGYPYYSVLIVSIIIEALSYFIRLKLLIKYSNFNFFDIVKKTIFPCFKVLTIISIVIIPLNNFFMAYDLLSLFRNTFIMCLIMIMIFYLFGANKKEKKYIHKIILINAKKNRNTNTSF